ncbi:hypothetical protein N8I77_010329 [Diaporthe amygdali]|uniref:protein-ribulosamine 3-kinase n=1 Tax=Phomopsis amygdali TaxID=1214568 RepID=A0AAD9VZ99_PHOAM|nr:hypothetical protein N8I77_010329 [Diaporthe amygdali]
MALLHKKTGGTSPSGHFGCDRNKVPYDGKLPLLGGWEEDWSSYFTNLLKLSYSHALRVHSRTDLEEIMDATYNKLIPSLIEPLNRKIQPCLIHGDLWESNIGTDKSSGEIYIFDAAAYWAHNEKELGIWFCSHHAMHARFEEYAEAYWDAYGCGKQGPDGEWRQRVQLYSTQTMFMRCGSVRDDECWEAIMMTLTALLDTYCLNWDDRETAGMNLQQH